jgi:cytochrome c biogenesis protein CcmG, thiol:disulfide interchange protein DsbE
VHIILTARAHSSGKYHQLHVIYHDFEFARFSRGILCMVLTINICKMTILKYSSQRKSLFLPIIFLGLGLALIAASAYFILQDVPPRSDLSAVPVKVDFPAPELTLTDTAGNPSSLADYRGQVILVNLWATWCPPCKEEMPALESYYRRHVDEGFVIIAINDGDPAPDVIQFVEEYGLTFPVWLDPAYIATEQAFKTLNLPSSFVINREGQIVLSWVGGINLKTLEKHITPIIEEGK